MEAKDRNLGGSHRYSIFWFQHLLGVAVNDYEPAGYLFTTTTCL